MPVESTEKLKIKCDNPDCPGNTLDPTVRDGWLFVSGEVYGSPTQQFVFCSAACLGATASNPDVEPTFAAAPQPEMAPPLPEPPIAPEEAPQ